MTSTEPEIYRAWCLVAWAARQNAPCWLRAANLAEPANELGSTVSATGPVDLEELAEGLNIALLAANDAVVAAWSGVADRAGVADPRWAADERRYRCWQAVTRAVDLAVREATAMVTVEAAVSGPDDLVQVLRLADAVVVEAAEARAWQAVGALTAAPGWIWSTVPALAGAQVARVGYQALQPTAVRARSSHVLHGDSRTRTIGCSSSRS